MNIADQIRALGSDSADARDAAVTALLDMPDDCVEHLGTAVYLVGKLARSNAALVFGRTGLSCAIRPMIAWLHWEKTHTTRRNLVQSISGLWEERRSDCIDEAQDEFSGRADSWCKAVVSRFNAFQHTPGFSRKALEDLQLLASRRRPVFDAAGNLTGSRLVPRSRSGPNTGHGDWGGGEGQRKTKEGGGYVERLTWTWDKHGNIVFTK